MNAVEIRYDESGPGYSVYDGDKRLHGPAYLHGRIDGCVEFCLAQGWRVEQQPKDPAGSGIEWKVTR